jgi:hypothetical protein
VAERGEQAFRIRAWAGGAVPALAITSCLLRPGEPQTAVLPWGLVLSALTAGAVNTATLLFAWSGQELGGAAPPGR